MSIQVSVVVVGLRVGRESLSCCPRDWFVLLFALTAHAGGYGTAVLCTADLAEDTAFNGVVLARPTRIGKVTVNRARFNAAGRLTSGQIAGPEGRWFEGAP